MEIEIDVSMSAPHMEIMGPPGMEEMTQQLQGLFENMHSDRKKKRTMPVKQAMVVLREEEAAKLINAEDVKTTALENVEQNGIVFIDEIDKICKRENVSGGDVSREGVQRDLLPLIEGSTVNTKYGSVKPYFIYCLRCVSRAKPSDLIPELQGRLPIRVELQALAVEDFVRILTEPNASLTEQYMALMATEGLQITFTEDAVERLAEIAWQVNEKVENIGARRLHTLMERLLEELSFTASEKSGDKQTIDVDYVNKALKDLAQDEDLSRYIL